MGESWCLWGHLVNNPDWSINSYIKIATISDVTNLLGILQNIPDELLINCMFFFYKENILPIYEDPNNRKGGYFSYVISNQNVKNVWSITSLNLMEKNLSTNIDFMSNINGITLSPKKNFCILKIILKSCEFQSTSLIKDIDGIDKKAGLFTPI
jgi:hypothetical protein